MFFILENDWNLNSSLLQVKLNRQVLGLMDLYIKKFNLKEQLILMFISYKNEWMILLK